MTPEELNMALRMEIIHYRETDELTSDLKLLIMLLIWKESTKPRYKGITDNIRILCESKAYIDCCKHCMHYNPEKSDNARTYVMQLISCAFACEIRRNWIDSKIEETIKI